MGNISSPVTDIPVGKTEIRKPGLSSFSCERIEMFTKEIVVRRDLGIRASPVNQAHMKRLQIMELLYSVPNLLDY